METNTPIWEFPSDHEMLAAHVALSGKRVVDVGAGAGGLVRFVRSAGAEVIGVECGEAMISQARAADLDHPEAYVEGVGQDLPLDDASADIVVFCYSMHHVPAEHLPAALSESDRVLRSGGILAVLEPIAEGPGHQVHKPIDDETVVRAAAQAALDNDLPASLTQVEDVRYVTNFSYSGMDDLEKMIVDVDPTRRAAIDEVRDEVAALFELYGEPHGDRYWFAQPVVMRLFSKA